MLNLIVFLFSLWAGNSESVPTDTEGEVRTCDYDLGYLIRELEQDGNNTWWYPNQKTVIENLKGKFQNCTVPEASTWNEFFWATTNRTQPEKTIQCLLNSQNFTVFGKIPCQLSGHDCIIFDYNGRAKYYRRCNDVNGTFENFDVLVVPSTAESDSKYIINWARSLARRTSGGVIIKIIAQDEDSSKLLPWKDFWCYSYGQTEYFCKAQSQALGNSNLDNETKPECVLTASPNAFELRMASLCDYFHWKCALFDRTDDYFFIKCDDDIQELNPFSPLYLIAADLTSDTQVKSDMIDLILALNKVTTGSTLMITLEPERDPPLFSFPVTYPRCFGIKKGGRFCFANGMFDRMRVVWQIGDVGIVPGVEKAMISTVALYEHVPKVSFLCENYTLCLQLPLGCDRPLDLLRRSISINTAYFLNQTNNLERTMGVAPHMPFFAPQSRRAQLLNDPENDGFCFKSTDQEHYPCPKLKILCQNSTFPDCFAVDPKGADKHIELENSSCLITQNGTQTCKSISRELDNISSEAVLASWGNDSFYHLLFPEMESNVTNYDNYSGSGEEPNQFV